jgi:signal transduction histidine kinase
MWSDLRRRASARDGLVPERGTELRGHRPMAFSVMRLAIRDPLSLPLGIEVPPGAQSRLFERFFRASAASERATQGTGLGLAIAKATAESHDGTISVERAEGEGTTFRVELRLGPLEPNALVAAGQVAA